MASLLTRTGLLFGMLALSAPALGHEKCALELGEEEDLRTFLFHHTADSIWRSRNISENVLVTGSLSDDLGIDAGRHEAPVTRLLELVRPASFRQARQSGIIRFLGNPCDRHEVSFEAVSKVPATVWQLVVTLENGRIQAINADRFYYEKYSNEG